MKKILVIDDADFILESTSTLLEFEGYDIFTAKDGKLGLEKAKEIEPDLILCDISMPVMDGYQVLENIRKLDITRRTPFIFLTAFNEKSNMREGMEKGADDYLVKPYTREELISAIEAQWRKSSVFEEHVKSKVEEVGKNVTYALPHEFRTGINQIKGAAGILHNDPDLLNDGEIKSLASDIIESVKRLSKITENYLTYIRINSISGNPAEKEALRRNRMDEPFAVASDIISNIASKYDRNSDLELVGDVFDVVLEGSSENFFKIISELSDNAFRFSDKGTPVKLISSQDSNKVWFKISDEGIGMSEDQINSIAALNQFDRNTNEQQGVGLGLVIAKRLIELHDGEFKVNSMPQKGTTIEFSLPIQNQ